MLRELRSRGTTLASCEGASGGLLARRLLRIDTAGEIYRGGLTGLSNHTLAAFLELPPDPRPQSQPHGPEWASQLAVATRHRLQVDYALAITTRSWLEDSEQSAKAPFAHYALATPQGVVEVRELNLAGDPAIAQARLTKSALNLLRLHLRGN